MPQLSNYDIYIFDCDGVILDSNQLKIEAMKNALEAHFSDSSLIEQCVDYFRNNFGKSRFHHVAHFLDNILTVTPENRTTLEQDVLANFSKQCRSLYLKADLTPDVINFIEQCKGKRFVASGSEQNELRDIFCERGLDKYFDGVYGSPTPKAEIIKQILHNEQSNNAVMFGDAESDMLSAHTNHIDFVFYHPYSNIKDTMLELCTKHQHAVIYDFSTVRIEQ